MKKIKKLLVPLFMVGLVVTLACVAMELVGINNDIVSFIADLVGVSSGGCIMAAGPGATVQGGAEIGDNDAEYLDDVLKREIIKVRPNDTPLDTITRELNNSEEAKGMEVGGWEVGTRDINDTVKSANTKAVISSITVNNVDMWLPGDIVSVPGVAGRGGKDLALYIIDRGADGASISVKAINSTDNQVPVLDVSAGLLRIGSAASEKQAQATAFAMTPATRTNYCQIHMTQIEETVLHGLAKKKVDLNFGVFTEQGLWDFRRAMELNNLFSVKGIVTNKNNENVYTSDGVWNQIDNVIAFDKDALTNKNWVSYTRQIFDGNNGADRRMLFAGSGFIEMWAGCTDFQKQLDAGKTEVVCGVKVKVVETNFGTLLLKPMGTLFSGDMTNNAIVLDMGNVVKKVFEPLKVDTLELDKTGQKRSNAKRILETYCLYLENLPTHTKFIMNK